MPSLDGKVYVTSIENTNREDCTLKDVTGEHCSAFRKLFESSLRRPDMEEMVMESLRSKLWFVLAKINDPSSETWHALVDTGCSQTCVREETWLRMPRRTDENFIRHQGVITGVAGDTQATIEGSAMITLYMMDVNKRLVELKTRALIVRNLQGPLYLGQDVFENIQVYSHLDSGGIQFRSPTRNHYISFQVLVDAPGPNKKDLRCNYMRMAPHSPFKETQKRLGSSMTTIEEEEEPPDGCHTPVKVVTIISHLRTKHVQMPRAKKRKKRPPERTPMVRMVFAMKMKSAEKDKVDSEMSNRIQESMKKANAAIINEVEIPDEFDIMKRERTLTDDELLDLFDLDHLDEATQKKVKKLILKYTSIWSEHNFDLGLHRFVQHNIVLTAPLPPCPKQRFWPAHKREAAEELIDYLERYKKIEKTITSWATNVVLIKKQADPANKDLEQALLDALMEGHTIPAPPKAKYRLCLDLYNCNDYKYNQQIYCLLCFFTGFT